MFETGHHLRFSKMIVYQLAMILHACPESVSNATLPGSLLICFDSSVHKAVELAFQGIEDAD